METNRNSFKSVSANEYNPKWYKMIERNEEIYTSSTDIRSPFERDFNRILCSNAYNRLKHKTQVFFSPEDDHICTRIGHVNYVESVSYTIANYLGLNTELTRAIAFGHDVGHAPFGHRGEKILSEISTKDIGKSFWHEKNGLDFVDNIELLEDYDGYKRNLNLTYAVRDGIISHYGEVDETSLKPREEAINLNTYEYPNQYAPYTWEGCIVKVADKISYLGVDIEDAIKEGFLDDEKIKELNDILGRKDKISNALIMNRLITDICKHSSPEKGITLSVESLELMNRIKEYNYKNIYVSSRMKPSEDYFKLVINQIYNILKDCFDEKNTINNLKKIEKYYPMLSKRFLNWLHDYSNLGNRDKLKNKIIFDINNEKEYYSAIISYIAGMTDKYAIDLYNEIIHF